MWFLLAACLSTVPDGDSADFTWGTALPGPLPPPIPIELVAPPADLVAGTDIKLTVTGASVGETVVFVRSGEVGAGPCPKKLGGLCLEVAAPLHRVGIVLADAAGVATATWTVPDAPGQTVCFQAAITRGPLGVDSVTSKSSCSLIGTGLDPDGCGLGLCVGGSYVEGGACLTPVGYAPDALISLLVCGGVIDPCCGLGTCSGGSYVDDCLAYAPSDPLSQVVCNGAYDDGNGVGSCVGDSWCDDFLCYIPGGDVSTLFCGCQDGPEVTPGCGEISCATYCDDCVCYVPDAPEVLAACPGGTGAFKRYFNGTSYSHLTAGVTTWDGWVTAGWALADAHVLRLDRDGVLLWDRKDAGTSWWDVASTGSEHTVAGQDAVANLDDSGNVLWWADLPGTNWISEAVTISSSGDRVVLASDGLNLYLTRFDALGNAIWAKILGGTGNETALDLLELPSGDLLLLAVTTSWGAGAEDLVFIRLTSAGALVSATTVGGAGSEAGPPLRSKMALTADGGVSWATESTSYTWGSSDAFYGKFDPDTATVDWAWHFGWTGFEFASVFVEKPDGNFWLMGEEFTDYNGFFVSETDSNGTPLTAYSWGEDPYYNYMDAGVAPDGSPWIATETHHHPVGPLDHKFYLMKGDPDGQMASCCEVEPLLSADVWPVSPTLITVTPTILATALPVLAVHINTFGLATQATLCDVRHDYVCGGPLTTECLCPP